MRITERAVLFAVAGIVLLVSVFLAIVDGELAGFHYPGSEAIFTVVFVASGAVITRAHPWHAVGRLLMWAGLLGAFAQLSGQLDLNGTSFLLFGSWGLMLVAIARFPDGAWVSVWSKRLVFGVIAGFAAQALLWWVLPLVADPSLADDPPWWSIIGLTLASIFATGFVLVTIVAMWRSVRQDPIRRRQVSIVIAGGLLMFVLGELAGPLEDAGSPASGVLNSLSALVFPITVVIAIMRYRLYEIDRVLSRTVSYGLIIGIAVAVYFIVVTGMQALLPIDGEVAVALSTLIAWAASVPWARRFRAWVDQRFFRSRYDAAAVVARVANELRSTVDLAEVEARAESVIEEVFAPEYVSLWLAEDLV